VAVLSGNQKNIHSTKEKEEAIMAKSPPYVLFVNSNPICTPAIKLAQQFGPQLIQIVDTRAIPVNQRPTWLTGVPTMINTQRQGPLLTGTQVISWLQACQGRQSSSYASQPSSNYPPSQSALSPFMSQRGGGPQQQMPQQTAQSRKLSAMDTLFQAEFDRQGHYVGDGGMPGHVQLQEDTSIGSQYVGAGTSNNDHLYMQVDKKITDADLEHYQKLRDAPRARAPAYIGESDLEAGVKLTM
jgi:hypothetical protein